MTFFIKVLFDNGDFVFVETNVERLGRDCEVIFTVHDVQKVEVIKIGE